MVLDVNTQVGDDIDKSSNEWHIFEFHWPTAGWGFALVIGGLIILGVLYYLYKRRQHKYKKQLTHQKALTWQALEWHRSGCNKVDKAKQCDCRKPTDKDLHIDNDKANDNRSNRHSYFREA